MRKIRNIEPTTVTVFTDSQMAISKILNPKTRVDGETFLNLVYQNAYAIKIARYIIVMQLVPSHSRIPDNEKADAVIEDVVHKRGREINYWSSLIHI